MLAMIKNCLEADSLSETNVNVLSSRLEGYQCHDLFMVIKLSLSQELDKVKSFYCSIDMIINDEFNFAM